MIVFLTVGNKFFEEQFKRILLIKGRRMAEEAPNAVKDAKAPDPNPVLEPVLDPVLEPVLEPVVDPKLTIFTLMHRLEQDALDKVLSIQKTVATEDMKKTGDTIGDKLLGIMEQGAQEFKKETGRNMTYSEMRYMYG